MCARERVCVCAFVPLGMSSTASVQYYSCVSTRVCVFVRVCVRVCVCVFVCVKDEEKESQIIYECFFLFQTCAESYFVL